jgi:hypothetical protein
MTEKKRYLIDLLLKVSRQYSLLEEQLSKSFLMFSNLFKELDEEQLAQIESTLTPEEILDKLIPVIDSHFTVDELEVIIHFYSSPVGRKLTDSDYETKCNSALQVLFDEVELAFIQAANRNRPSATQEPT